ncbi:unnamed protein product [Ceutorhynchus assimilis]|uniref:Deoxyribodipyrimidine photo-lyase n=1 Tax=Ceutorhynchus assimilis TaxID=467358 RepID=A0A9N9MHW3_9CUCU|nr:unnamed protein product [Ceutorhynchus assimilis]
MASLKPRDFKSKLALSSLTKEQFLDEIIKSRKSQAESIENFAFNKSRCRVLSKTKDIASNSKGVLYWMIRDCRVQDNWAMLFAQRLALRNKIPLMVCFSLFETHLLHPTRRHQQFLIDGLRQVEQELTGLNIPFYLIKESPKDLAKIVADNKLGGVVCDFSPLRKPKEWIDILLKNLPGDVPLVQVDAHNIVPAWIASDKQEHMARTLRPKINKKLSEYLTGYPQVFKHPHTEKIQVKCLNKLDNDEISNLIETLWEVEPVSNKAGSNEGLEALYKFLQNGLKHYGVTSNDPSKNHTSNLSYWITFGQISAQRIALETKSLESIYKEQVEKYLEELIVRKELAENYCLYNKNYDSIEGAADWAKSSLILHKSDKRTYTYTREELEKSQTHDEMWNAAQLQALKEGKIHGYMRMYWCKKILEWTKSPEEALEFALWLNDTFALDGNCPNGFVGVMWSICGVHDQGWREREIFGKIRFMVDYSLRKKYDMDAYCARYGIGMKEGDKKWKKGTKRKLAK